MHSIFDSIKSKVCYPWEVRYRAVSRIQGTVPEATMSVVPNQGNGKITVPELLQRKSSTAASSENSNPADSKKIVCLTAYDYPTARLLDEAGVDVILVGDSLAMVALGYDSTLPVTLDEMIHHARAVRRLELIARLTEAVIPVMGHIGLTPQSVNALGGYRVQGKTTDGAEQLLRDARAVEAAGAFAIVLEAVPRELAAQITKELRIPTIGIGAGPD